MSGVLVDTCFWSLALPCYTFFPHNCALTTWHNALRLLVNSCSVSSGTIGPSITQMLLPYQDSTEPKPS